MLLDNLVFKLKDSRLEPVFHGRLSVLSLVYTIHPGDWLIIHKNTVYALTLDLYYAAQQLIPLRVLSKELFLLLLKIDLLLDLKDDHLFKIMKLYKSKCSVCQYNTFKNKLLSILKRYPKYVLLFKLKNKIPSIPAYPLTTSAIVSKVPKIFPVFFEKLLYERKSCLDCVLKHVGMAYIKGCLSLQGYPLHFNLAVANLHEAYELCPKDCQLLKLTLMFCIGKSTKLHKPFIPLSALLYNIELARALTKIQEAHDLNQPDLSFDLELTSQIKDQLSNIPMIVKVRAISDLNKIIDILYGLQSKLNSVKYQGYMGSVADLLLQYSLKAANIIRNRRIMFKVSPDLTRDTEYDCKDIIQAIKGSNNQHRTNQEN